MSFAFMCAQSIQVPAAAKHCYIRKAPSLVQQKGFPLDMCFLNVMSIHTQ